MKFDTLVIHGGIDGDQTTGAVSVPIYQTSTYAQIAPGQHKGFDYSRTINPTRLALEKLIADLEGGYQGFAFSSGMAAISSVLMLFRAGDHLIISDDVYGGTFRVMDKVFRNLGLEFTFVDTSQVSDIQKEIRSNTKAVYVETPTNPLMRITDIKAVAEAAHASDLLLLVDNTFMTPYLQKPLALGADVVLHSATKYLGGHSDLIAGAVVVKTAEVAQKLQFIQNAVGAILAPQDAWLLIRGIKTLAVRMERHCHNAEKVVQWLQGQNWVKKIYYPGLGDRPIPAGQMLGRGGMVSFQVDHSETLQKLLSGLRTFTLAESLGGVESLISVPAVMTHASIPPENRRRLGITDTLVRISVGIEDADDIIADLDIARK